MTRELRSDLRELFNLGIGAGHALSRGVENREAEKLMGEIEAAVLALLRDAIGGRGHDLGAYGAGWEAGARAACETFNASMPETIETAVALVRSCAGSTSNAPALSA